MDINNIIKVKSFKFISTYKMCSNYANNFKFLYYKNDRKINFGNEKDFEGGNAKINNKDRAKAFSDRHNCPAKKDKLSPGYWSCNLPRYAKDLGLTGGGNYFW